MAFRKDLSCLRIFLTHLIRQQKLIIHCQQTVKVSLKIYDSKGMEIMTLVNEVKTAGYYSVDFYATGLSSGVYFYSISSDKHLATKKMLLIK
ncbi:MAG: T9SS type A sorting domain-containing protein [Ignavibacteria bacterium]